MPRRRPTVILISNQYYNNKSIDWRFENLGSLNQMWGAFQIRYLETKTPNRKSHEQQEKAPKSAIFARQ